MLVLTRLSQHLKPGFSLWEISLRRLVLYSSGLYTIRCSSNFIFNLNCCSQGECNSLNGIELIKPITCNYIIVIGPRLVSCNSESSPWEGTFNPSKYSTPPPPWVIVLLRHSEINLNWLENPALALQVDTIFKLVATFLVGTSICKCTTHSLTHSGVDTVRN